MSRWRRDFSHSSRPVLGSTQPPMLGVPSFFLGGKGPRRGATTHPIQRQGEKVGLYLHSLSGTSWTVLGRNLPFTFIFYKTCRIFNTEATAKTSMRNPYIIPIKLLMLPLQRHSLYPPPFLQPYLHTNVDSNNHVMNIVSNTPLFPGSQRPNKMVGSTRVDRSREA